LATAQQRLENELGARGVRNTAPAVFQRQVQERVETLRQNHDCVRHSWRYRQGGGRCEECHFNLPQFLLVRRRCFLCFYLLTDNPSDMPKLFFTGMCPVLQESSLSRGI
jgi:hypothetical protein